MAGTLRDDARLHRLWYDLRNQSLFDESFRDDVHDIDQSLERMLWRIASRYTDLAGAPPTVSSSLAYRIFYGPFQPALTPHHRYLPAPPPPPPANTPPTLLTPPA